MGTTKEPNDLFRIFISANTTSELKEKLGKGSIVNLTLLKKEYNIQTRNESRELSECIDFFVVKGGVKEIGYADVHELRFLN